MLFSANLALLAFFMPKEKRKKKDSLCIREGSTPSKKCHCDNNIVEGECCDGRDKEEG
jgi:hypothetical protein